MTLVLTPGPLEHMGYKNVLMLHAEALRTFCGQMSAEHDLTFDTTFLDAYATPRWWFLEHVPNMEVRSKLKVIV